MREKLQTLPLTELKELAKAQGIRGISGMKKSDLIALLCEKDKEAEDQKKPAPQRHMPAPVKLGNTFRRIGMIKVGNKFKSQHHHQPRRHQGISPEIKI